jgi:choline dehydrogenase
LPYFKKMETVEGKDPDYRGDSGPMHPKIAADPNPLSEVFLDAAKELDYPLTDDFNGAVQEGAGWHELTIEDGRRQSTAVAYLHPATDRPNLSVHTNALARRLTFDGKRCSGVEYERAGSVEKATAEVEVIVCGGAVNSPQLLLLSGVGPAAHLREVGTCKIGTDDAAVVDPELRVHGIEGLRVADASVLPTVVCVNTNAASIMIGEKAADLVRGAGEAQSA